ncbi:hypothetical protein SAMN04487851_10849 [Prevotella sp. tc2-28]|uniref:hypothetical protein n=1 Tax=Prevotella sp. tc2-28 TaxID=1761888 RepID=UPI00089B7F9F|nr:hypothetical protein [Prevotella sp. tc2-28]SEA54929.1 hypothetical protein SAMN04487851_10849 [Prevotella sp. tc2-28]
MKRMLNWAIALILISGSSLLVGCAVADDPYNPEADRNRDMLATHFKADASVLADNLNFDAITLSSQTTLQLLALMNKSRTFKEDVKKMIALLTIQNLTDRTNSHGLRIIFDEKGNYQVGPSEGMVFIFPATVDGYGKMLYKLSMASNRNFNEVPELLRVTLSCMYQDKEVVLNSSVASVKMTSDFPGMAAITLGTFSFESKIDYFLPDAKDAAKASTIDIVGSRESDGNVNFQLGYVQNKLNILDANMNIPLPADYVIKSIRGMMETVNSITVSSSILDDLYVTGNIKGDMQIACGKDGSAIPMKFVDVQEGETTLKMPAFALDYSSDYTLLKDIVDADTYAQLMNLYQQTASRISVTSTDYADLLTMLLQILPIATTN